MGNRKNIVIIVLAGVAGSFGLLGYLYLISNHAAAPCPLGHRLNHNWYCKVLDTRDNGTERLVLHYYQPTGEVELWIHRPDMIHYLSQPFGRVSDFKELSNKQIKFGGGGLLIDGEPYPISITNTAYNESPLDDLL